MDKSVMTSRSPLHILEESVNGGLEKGKVTVIASKKGVGKTACLVHISIEKLLENKQVLHVSFSKRTDYIISWYEDLFNELAVSKKIENIAELREEVMRNRVIMSFAQKDGIVDQQLLSSLSAMMGPGNFKADTLIIGGGMAYTFLAAKGYTVGTSLLDETKIEYCKDMLAKAEEKGVKILLPIDVTTAKAFPDPIDAEIEVTVYDADKIPADVMGLDIGPKTAELYADAVKSAKTVVWNGPMGCFEMKAFSAGTFGVCEAVAAVKENGGISIIGGGDSVSAVKKSGQAAKMSHISTGGGASLEFLEGKELPGCAALDDK